MGIEEGDWKIVMGAKIEGGDRNRGYRLDGDAGVAAEGLGSSEGVVGEARGS